MSQDASATAVALRCTLDYPDVETFIVRYGRNLSPRGIFLPSQDPPPAGTAVRFEVLLSDGRAALRGDGVVVGRASLDGAEPERLHGMAVRFVRLDAASRSLVERVATYKTAHPNAYYDAAPDLVDKTLPGMAAELMPIPTSGERRSPSPTSGPTGRVSVPMPPMASGPEQDELDLLRRPPAPLPQLSPRETAQRLEALLARRS